MNHFRIGVAAFAVAFGLFSGGVRRGEAAEVKSITLSLQDAIRQAVEKNLDVRVELYNPAIAEADVRRSQAIYDPQLTIATSYDRSSVPAYSLAGTLAFSDQDTLQLNLGGSQLVNTGGTLGLVFNNSYNKGGGSNYYQSLLAVTFAQPLLKNYGRDATELNINLAKYTKEGSLERFRTRLSNTVAQVRTEYFGLYNLRENLEVKRTSLALAKRILDETRGRVKAGVLPAMEILNAEFGVATREKDVIDAERLLKDKMDLLRQLLQLSGQGDIAVTDQPSKEAYAVIESEAVKRALATRPEILEQQAALKGNELQVQVSRSRTMPDLTLNANAGLAGVDKNYGGDLKHIAALDTPAWGIGLQLTYPLGNGLAENDYVKSRLQRDQTQTGVRNLESSITRDVKSATRNLQVAYRQLEVTERGRAYAEERLKAFIKRNEVGLATIKDVLDVENNMVTAKGDQISALVNYGNAVTNLWLSTGEILERSGIKFENGEADSLYGKSK